MADPPFCANCGAPQPASSPEGLCPRCLMEQALGGSVADASTNALPPCGHDRTVAREPGSSSALAGVAHSIGGIPHVLLRDTEIETGPGPVLKPCSTEMPAPAQRPDRYQLFGEIARGGMGAVFRGRDVDLGRDLAVKVLLDAHKNQPELIKRFIEEAQIGGQLQHPGVVPVYELGSFADRRPFFTMKLVKGQTLADLLRARSSPADDLPRFLSIFAAMAQTLAYAHTRGVIHRDLKPSNIMVGSFGEVQVMDWGLAKVLPQGGVVADQPEPAAEPAVPVSVIQTARTGSGADASQAGSVLGTPAYMAPEQARGEMERVDERADVFGLGAILCEILTGEPAFTGRSPSAIVLQATLGEMDRTFARLDVCGAERELIALAKDCLAPQRDDRPRRAGVVAERVTAYLADVQERLRHAELARVEERARRRLTMAGAAAVVGLMVLSGGGWGFLQRVRAARAAGIERAVTTALDEANLLRGQARSQPAGEMTGWSEAISAARRAEGLLAGGDAGEEVQGRVRTALADLNQERAEAQAQADTLRRDLELLHRLESIYGALTVSFDSVRVDAEFMAAFRDFGVDLDRLDPKEAGRLLRGRSAPIELAWYLDGAALNRVMIGRPEADWRRLVEVARSADPDPWRDKVRATMGRRDPAAVAMLSRLADDAKGVEAQPAWSLVILAMQLQNGIGDALRAESVFRRAWKLKPDDFFVNFLLGVSLRDESIPNNKMAARRAEAVNYLTAAVAIRPTSAIARAHLGVALEYHGKLDEAIGEYRAAVRLQPDLQWAYFQLGLALERQGKSAETIAEYRAAIRLKPRDASLHIGLGEILFRQRKLADAIAAYQEGIRIDPGIFWYHARLGDALLDHGKQAEAIVAYREVIRLNPDFELAHFNLGRTLAYQGKSDAAVEELRAADRLKPDHADILKHLAWSLALPPDRPPREYDEAARCARKDATLAPEGNEVYFVLALAEYRCGRSAEAVAAAERSMAMRKGGDALDWFIMAMALAQKGDEVKAAPWFDKAVEWTKQKDVQNLNLRQFWAETAKLLGRPGPPALKGQGHR